MTRATPLALVALLALGALAACGPKAGTPEQAAANASAPGADEVEALPSDGLAAPEGMAIDSESGAGETTAPGGNAVGSAGGGNAM